ncbi:beta strand repeat-containing protein [Amycolatopsis anabasis]|uniref:beta strand repeat-containing protein n=1 Tax=Amycolatopsis anabasis TaxID=1840409 RepID=UPI00131EB10C|nr:chaplin family protein [Amycolatopsis anabasis]
MQTWAKRGLQTALVTGGLLMLGTGIASADERVAGPDQPAGPLDVTLGAPLQFKDNALGLPVVGTVKLPDAEVPLSTKPLTAPVNGVAKAAEPVAKATAKAAKGGDAKADAQQAPSGDLLKGNKVTGDLAVPIQFCGNAIGVVGDAKVEGADCTQTYEHHQDVTTSGEKSGIAGNVVALDWAAPVQIAGNGVGALGGSGSTNGTASQSAVETGNVTTTGQGSGTSGNVAAPALATPIQITGNAASWPLANGYSDFAADTSAESGGYIVTDGEGGSTSGNVAGAPIALPVKFNGNAAAAWGSDADAVSNSSADAKAGGTTPGINNIDSYIQTGGDNSFVDGNIIQPQGSLLANVDSVAASWIGNATTGNALGDGATASSSSSEVESGGFSSTSGKNSAGSGNIADLPVALPAELCGIGGTYIGNAHAACDNTADLEAGDGTYTNGDGSFLGSNTVTGQLASTAELFGIGGSHIGNASGTATEEKEVTAGGYNGTTGNDASGSGNLVQVPLAVPFEVFGIGGSYIGQGKGSATETKVVEAGGGGNTQDDNGFATSNLVATPLSIPAQVFGIGGSHIGRGVGEATADTTTKAGGNVHATGDKAGAAGNIGFLPIALPLQVHGIGGSFIGTGSGTADNLTTSTAGGTADTSGMDGAVSGNIIQAPFAGAGVLYSSAAGLIALVEGEGTNDVTATAGGDSTTNGDGGGVTGNVISAQMLPIAQVFGDAVAAGAKATGIGANVTEATSGGDITTSGVNGGGAGNIIDVPVAAVAQVFGNAIAAAGVADATGDNQTTGSVGGATTTSPANLGALSGVDGQLPLGAVVQIFGVSLPVLGHALGVATNATDITVDETVPQINLPIDGSELSPTALPAMPSLPQQRADVQDTPEVKNPVNLGGLDLSKLASLRGVGLKGVGLKGVGGHAAPQAADVPAIASVDSSPEAMMQRFLGGLSGKNLHIL